MTIVFGFLVLGCCVFEWFGEGPREFFGSLVFGRGPVLSSFSYGFVIRWRLYWITGS